MDECHPRGDRTGNHDATGFEPPIARGDDRDEHPFVDPEPAEPLRNDDVDTFGQRDVGHVTVDYFDDLADPVRDGQLLRSAATAVRSTA